MIGQKGGLLKPTVSEVINTPLTGFIVGTNTPITDTNTILQAFQNTQGQLNAITGASSIFVKRDGTTALTGNWTAGNFYISAQTIGVNTGSTTPSSNFHVVSTSTSTVRGILNDQYSNSTDSAKIYNRKARGTFASPTVIVTGDTLGNWTSTGYDGTSFIDTSDIRVISTSTISTGVIPSQMLFRTTSTSGVLSVALYINESQMVGIGTTSPTSTLQVLQSVVSSGTVPCLGITQADHTGGTPKILLITGGTVTNTTASTEIIDIDFALNRTVNHTGGDYANQRSVVIRNSTHTATSATIITDAATLLVAGPPIASTNITITNPYSIMCTGNMNMKTGNIKYTGQAGVIGTTDANQFSINTNNVLRTTWVSDGRQTHVQDASSSGTTTFITHTQADHTGGIKTGKVWNAGALTSQTVNTEITDINYNLSAVLKSIDGTIATNRSFRIQGRTFTPQTTALTITTAITLDVTASIAGSGTTITNNYAIRTNGDINLIGGNRTIVGSNGISITSGSASAITFSQGASNVYIIATTGKHSFTGVAQSSGTTAQFIITQPVNTGGSAGIFSLTAAAVTSQTIATEITDINYDLSAVLKSIDGTITTNRSFRIQGRTLTPQTSALTVTNPITLEVNPPIAGSGTTFTNPAMALKLTGNLSLGTAGNKIFIKEGTDGSSGQTTLSSGTKAITINGLTTSSRAFIQLVSESGASLTVKYQGVCTANTLTIRANIAAGTINTSDASTVNYFIIEPAP